MTYDALVVGGGQAGLAAGYYLQRAGLNFLILDAHAHTGTSWRQRWKGLRLFSPQRYNKLPGLPPPGDDWYLPTKDELADYLEEYARHFELPLVHDARVTGVEWENGYRLTTSRGSYHCGQLIIATGAYFVPAFPARLSHVLPVTIVQYHASEIRDVQGLVDADTSVLIVGAGASGQQLARLVLEAGGDVVLSGPKVANLPREVLGKDIYWWLYRAGVMSVRTDNKIGGWLMDERGGSVTVAERPTELAAHPNLRRIEAYVQDYRDGRLHFDGGSSPLTWPGKKRGLVFWCTGYHNTYSWLPHQAIDAGGQPLQVGGSSITLPGLYFLGLPNLRYPNSSLVGGVGRDAKEIVDRLAKGAHAKQAVLHSTR